MEQDKIIDVIEKGLEENKDSYKSLLEKQSEDLEKQIEKTQKQIDEQAKLNGEVREETKNKLNNLEDTVKSVRERIDAFEKKNGRLGGGEQNKSFQGLVSKSFEEDETRQKLQALKEGQTRNVSIDLDTDMKMRQKATMTQASDWTNDVVEPTRVPGIQFDPERRVRVRQFLPQGTTDSNQIYYVEETAFSDNTATVAEGSNIPENDLDLEQKAAQVRKIGATFRIGRESLEDFSALSSHLSLRGMQHYMNEEDDQLLYGDGTGQNLDGLTTTATDYTLDQYTGDSNAQEYDILLEAVKQLQDANYAPTAAMISISRFYDMVRRKDTDGNYIMPEAVIFGTDVPRVNGVPIIATNALNDDDFLVADFPMLTTLFDRRGVQVRFFEQDRDNVQKDLITVQITGRLALPTYLPNAGRYGDFANAITNAGNS